MPQITRNIHPVRSSHPEHRRDLDLTVVVPTHNRWALLQRALRSALNQEETDLEVVVVDDGSDDRVPKLAELEDPRTRLLRHQEPRGVAAARNTGLIAARGGWVGFLDDDVWAPRRARTLLDAARASGADFVYSGAILVDAELRPIAAAPAPNPRGLRDALRARNAIPGGGSNMLVETPLLKRVGGFNERFSFGEDWELWLRLANAYQPGAVAQSLVAHSYHADNTILRDEAAARHHLDALRREHGVSLRRSGADQQVAQTLWWLGYRSAAARLYFRAGIRNLDLGNVARGARAAVLSHRGARRLRLVARAPQPPEWLRAYSGAS